MNYLKNLISGWYFNLAMHLMWSAVLYMSIISKAPWLIGISAIMYIIHLVILFKVSK